MNDSSKQRVIKKAPNVADAAPRKYFFHNARKGFEHLLRQLNFAPDQNILLPAYIGISEREGSGVLDPVQANNLQHSFYAVDASLQIDMASLRAALDSQTDKLNVAALLVIHYFGFVQPEVLEIRRLCNERNIVLIEDCAHCHWRATEGGIPVGTIGDYSFFSIHKVIASRLGGMLLDNTANSSRTSRLTAPEENQLVNQNNAISFNDLASFASSDPADALKRIENYRFLAERLKAPSGEEQGFKVMYPSLSEGCIPMNLPIVLNDECSRHKIYWALNERGIETTALYYTLVPEIDEQTYPISHKISQQILNLPIHADLDKRDLDYIAAHVKVNLHDSD